MTTADVASVITTAVGVAVAAHVAITVFSVVRKAVARV